MNTASPHVKIKKTILTKGVTVLKEERLQIFTYVAKGDRLVELANTPKRHNIHGKRVNRFVVLYKTKEKCGHNSRWLCLCDCGRTFLLDTSKISKGKIIACGCSLSREKQVIEKLRERLLYYFGDKYSIVSEYKAPHKYIKLLCKDCKFIGDFHIFDSVYRGSVGCKCNKSHPYAKEQVLNSVSSLDYTLIGDLPKPLTSTAVLNLRCNNCGEIIEREVNRLVYHKFKHLCRNIDATKGGTFVYLLRASGTSVYKIGVAECYKLQSRVKDLNRCQDNYMFSVIGKKILNKRRDAFALEATLHRHFKDKRHTPRQAFGGSTELFELCADDLAYIRDIEGWEYD